MLDGKTKFPQLQKLFNERQAQHAVKPFRYFKARFTADDGILRLLRRPGKK